MVKLTMLFFVLSLPVFLHNGFFKPADYLDVTDRDYTTEEELKWRVSKMSFEYVPKGVATKLSDIGTTQLDLEREEIAKESFDVIEGPLKVIEIKNFPHKKIFKTNGEGKLKVNVFNFPGWKAFCDGKEVKIEASGKLKLIALKIPKGEHQVKVVFTDTPIRRFANFLSLGSFIIILIGGFYGKKIFC